TWLNRGGRATSSRTRPTRDTDRTDSDAAETSKNGKNRRARRFAREPQGAREITTKEREACRHQKLATLRCIRRRRRARQPPYPRSPPQGWELNESTFSEGETMQGPKTHEQQLR